MLIQTTWLLQPSFSNPDLQFLRKWAMPPSLMQVRPPFILKFSFTMFLQAWPPMPSPPSRFCRPTHPGFAKLSMRVLDLANLSVAALILCGRTLSTLVLAKSSTQMLGLTNPSVAALILCGRTLSTLGLAKPSTCMLGLANPSVAALILCTPIPLCPRISQIEHPDAHFGKSECYHPRFVVLLLYYPWHT